MSATAREASIHGRVQGVFFRDSCRAEAESLGVAGWVSNQPDGSVAAHFEGTAEAVEAMLDWCRTGPPSARVAGVEVTVAEPTGETAFVIR